MANNPITQSLPADLPVSWTYGQTVAPTGAEAGLSEQHGYNYLMEQVNAAQRAASEIGEAFGNLSPSDIGAASDDVVTEIQNDLTSHKDDTAVHLRQLTCTKSGTVFQLAGLGDADGLVSCTFKAPSNYVSGNTFTVDGTAYAVQLSNGETPDDNMFVSGAVVSIILDTTGKKVNFKSGGPAKTMVTEIIAATQEWTVPKGVRSISVRLFGAGGGGVYSTTSGGGGGGAGGHMAYNTFSVTPGTKYTVTIGEGGAASVTNNNTASSGGASSFGNLLSAAGGGGAAGGAGGNGGTGGGGSNAAGGSGNYGGGGGAGGNADSQAYSGGDGGTYGGGGGAFFSDNKSALGGAGGTYGGDGGGKNANPKNGINTIGKGLEFEGTGAAGTGKSGGGGGYGGVGGDGQSVVYNSVTYYSGGGGGGYGSKGGSAIAATAYQLKGGGGGGFGGNGGDAGPRGGGGGGGYGKSGVGGKGQVSSGARSGNGVLASGGGGSQDASYAGHGGNGVCVISYMGYR